VGFEITTPVFEWAKKVHAIDGAATVIGDPCIYAAEIKFVDHQKACA
jgi:hypothetical protein